MEKNPLTQSILILHHTVFFVLLCVGTLDLAYASNDEVPREAKEKTDLIDFVSRALVQNDQSLDIRDALISAELDKSAEEHKFKTELVPVANIGASTSAGTLGMGLEARRNNEFGTEFTVGVVSKKVTSDNFTVDNSHNTRAFIRVSQGLLRRWGHEYNRLGLTVAELKQQKADLDAHSTRQDLILSAVQAYYQAVLAGQLVVKTAQAQTRRKEHLEAARSRQSVGLVSMADVYRAELALLDMETSLKDQQRAYSLSIEDLYELLAVENTGTLVLDEEIEEITPVIMADWEQKLLEYRPDWRAHVIDRQITSHSQFKAERNLRPDLSLNLLLEQQGLGGNFADTKDLNETNWSVSLQLDSTLERFEQKTTVQRERLRARRLAREGQALKRRIHRDAQQAFEDLKAADRRHIVSGKRLVQAQKGLELSRIRYNRGLSSNLEVLDSEIAFTNAELDILRTLMDYNIAAVRLAHTLGILDLDWIKASMEPIEGENTVNAEDTVG
ncbi:TolC family protein [Pseudomonadota bacterium]